MASADIERPVCGNGWISAAVHLITAPATGFSVGDGATGRPGAANLSGLAPQISPNITISGYVYNTAAGILDAVVVPTVAD
jgi:hypothetical protein